MSNIQSPTPNLQSFISLILAVLLAACSAPPPAVTVLPPPAHTQLPAPGVAVRFSDLEAPTLQPTESPGAGAERPPQVAPLSVTHAAPVPDATATAAPPATLSAQQLASYDVRPPPDELVVLAQQVFGGNLPAQISIPRIEVNTRVTPVGWRNTGSGVEWDSPQYAAGFLVSSAVPGAVGNTVIYGHNNIFGEVFRDLDQVQPGDGIFITTASGQSFVYAVEFVETLQEKGITAGQQQQHLAYFNPTNDARLTLLSCWPYTGNSHRVAVVARLSG